MENYIITGIFSLAGVWLGYFLSRRQIKDQFLMETRRTIYAKLLSAAMSEAEYPREPELSREDSMVMKQKITEYNSELGEWRRNRKMLKGLSQEALLITQGKPLRDKLFEFISSYNPDNRLDGIEELMRNEIGI